MLSSSLLLASSFLAVQALDNGLNLVPQMGWNTWNRYGCNTNESIIVTNAEAIKNAGLLDLGYNYISIDDCWQADARENGTNKPVADPTKFPSGISNLTARIAALGFAGTGLYSDAGKYTCGGKFGSLGYEDIDAQWYADNNVTYLKYDQCFSEGRYGTPTVAFELYYNMTMALNRTGVPILLAQCSWGQDGVWNWGTETANSWRMSGDIGQQFDRYDDRCPCEDSKTYCQLAGFHCSMMNILEKAAGIGQKGRPGSWPDLDGLQVGNNFFTEDEERLQFTMWTLMKSPLILGNDVTNLSNQTLSIITNKDLIDIHQDPLGGCAYRTLKVSDPSGGTIQVWRSNLAEGNKTMAIINASPTTQTLTISMSQDYLIDESLDERNASYQLLDLWANSTLFQTVQGNFSVEVPTHGVRAFKVVPVTTA